MPEPVYKLLMVNLFYGCAFISAWLERSSQFIQDDEEEDGRVEVWENKCSANQQDLCLMHM